jgi:hypothetical protein
LPTHDTLSLDLTFVPDASDPSEIRHFVESHYRRVVTDAEQLARVGMAAHELLENAVKYATDGTARFTVEITRNGEAQHVRITLSNRAGERHRNQLQRLFAEMASSADALEHYDRLLRSPVERPLGLGAGVGLARVRAEGQMRLTLSCDGDRVCLRAEAELTSRVA